MRRFMQRFQPMTINCLLLLLCLFFINGCSWTSRQLGMSDSSQDAQSDTEESRTAIPDDANLADKRALLRLSFGITGPIHMVPKKGPVQTQASYTVPASKSKTSKGRNTPKMVVKRQPPKMAQPEPQTAAKTSQAATAAPEISPMDADQQKQKIDPKGMQPPTKLHTSVPFEPMKKTPPEPVRQTPPASVSATPPAASTATQPDGPTATQKQRGDIVYGTTQALREAVDKAVEQKTFLGYTDPFDAFPSLEGNDTMSAAFIPVDHPNHKVFYHAFYTPDKPFNRRVYGYTVIDMITKKDYGHFDGNADGKFEQDTLHPRVVFDDYIRTSKASFGEKMPEVERKKK